LTLTFTKHFFFSLNYTAKKRFYTNIFKQKRLIRFKTVYEFISIVSTVLRTVVVVIVMQLENVFVKSQQRVQIGLSK